MGSLLAAVLPLAVGAAVSPTLLALQILVLSGKQAPVERAWAVAAGSTLVLLGYTVLGLTVLNGLSGHGQQTTPRDAVKLAAGVILLLLGIRNVVRPGDAGEKQRRRAARVQNAGPGVFLGVGALGMLTNFTTLVLYFPALHEISRSSASDADKVVVTGVLLVVTLLPVVLPVLLVTLTGRRADPMLSWLNRFVSAHQRAINAAICFLFAALLLYGGIKGLA